MEEDSGLFSATDLSKPTAALCIVCLIAKSPERGKGSFRGLDGHSFSFFSRRGLLLLPVTWGFVPLQAHFPSSEPLNHQDRHLDRLV